MLRTQLPLFELEIIRFQFFQTFSKVSLVTQKCYAGMLRTQLPYSEVNPTFSQIFQSVPGYVNMLRTQLPCSEVEIYRTSYAALKFKL